MRELPSGTVTFLFTDVEGSTKLLAEVGDEAYAQVLAEHHRRCREAWQAHGGVEVGTEGDAFFVVFARASDALAAARAAQAKLAPGPLRVRMGLHTGEVLLSETGYVGLELHRAARIAAAGHGGQVLVSQSTAALLGADGLRDLGEHRFKDLAAPEHVYQAGAGDFPRLKTLYQTNLPVQPTPLVGREAELAQVLELMSNARLVTLTGAGGSGKTRLALQAAAELAEAYTDGVWWVSLAALRDPELVEPTIAQAVGAKDGLADYLRGKRTLLLLDNFEQLLEAAPGIADLLSEAPDVRVLATSRERLGLSAEQEYAVPTLVPVEAIALFTTRARQLKPGFAPDELVEKICRRLDGLPLALELAAARVKVLTPEQILERLGRSLELLTAGARDAPERQRTLRATIGWSYELLADQERELFARLAVFAGSFDLEAAEQVCDADLDTLAGLVDKSLLRQSEAGRFFLLETIREYAAELLDESGVAAKLRRRAADFYLARVELVEAELFGSEQRRVLDELEADFGNLRMVFDWALEQGDTDLVLRLAGALDPFWHARGRIAEARRWLEAALGAGAEACQPLVRAKALYGLAEIVELSSDHAQAELLFDESLELLRDLPESRELSFALWGRGEVAAAQGDLERARGFAESAVAVARRVGDWYSTIGSLNLLAQVAVHEGETSEARRLVGEGLAIAREAKQARPIARCLAHLAWLALVEDDCAGAATACEEGLALIRGTNDPKVSSELLLPLGLARLGMGEQRRGREAIQEALTLARSLGIDIYVRACFEGLAAAAAGDDPRRCALLLGAADAMRETAGEARTEDEEVVYAPHLRRARRSLSGEEWSAVHEQGRGKPLDEAIEYALESID